MKKPILLFFALLALKITTTYGSEVEVNNPQSPPQIILCSHGRDGNTWTRYCLEFLTKRPSIAIEIDTEEFLESKFNSPIGNTFKDLNLDYNKARIVKTHNLRKDLPNCHGNDLLIFIVRNYKECL